MELVLDCHSGISGDRFLAALIGLGADARKLHSLPARLSLEGTTLISEMESAPTQITKSTVRVTYGGKGEELAFPELSARLRRAWLPEAVQGAAETALYKLCKAEARRAGARVSDNRLDGEAAADALLTITAGIVLWAALGCPRITTEGPVVVGGAARHSTRELLANVPHIDGPAGAELTTPSAAALLGFLWREPSSRASLLVGEVIVPYGISEQAVRGALQAFLQEDAEGDEKAIVEDSESERLI